MNSEKQNEPEANTSEREQINGDSPKTTRAESFLKRWAKKAKTLFTTDAPAVDGELQAAIELTPREQRTRDARELRQAKAGILAYQAKLQAQRSPNRHARRAAAKSKAVRFENAGFYAAVRVPAAVSRIEVSGLKVTLFVKGGPTPGEVRNIVMGFRLANEKFDAHNVIARSAGGFHAGFPAGFLRVPVKGRGDLSVAEARQMLRVFNARNAEQLEQRMQSVQAGGVSYLTGGDPVIREALEREALQDSVGCPA